MFPILRGNGRRLFPFLACVLDAANILKNRFERFHSVVKRELHFPGLFYPFALSLDVVSEVGGLRSDEIVPTLRNLDIRRIVGGFDD